MDKKENHTGQQQLVTMTVADVEQMANERARDHVLQALRELQAWIDQGKDIQNYILLKKTLYTLHSS